MRSFTSESIDNAREYVQPYMSEIFLTPNFSLSHPQIVDVIIMGSFAAVRQNQPGGIGR